MHRQVKDLLTASGRANQGRFSRATAEVGLAAGLNDWFDVMMI